jgi:hypothetical protein
MIAESVPGCTHLGSFETYERLVSTLRPHLYVWTSEISIKIVSKLQIYYRNPNGFLELNVRLNVGRTWKNPAAAQSSRSTFRSPKNTVRWLTSQLVLTCFFVFFLCRLVYVKVSGRTDSISQAVHGSRIRRYGINNCRQWQWSAWYVA